MRISDWSSDVCSSDLVVETPVTRQPWWVQVAENALNSPAVGWVITIFSSSRIRPPPTSMSLVLASTVPASGAAGWSLDRSGERRVGKECVGKCRSRWSRYHEKKKKQDTTIATK